MPVVLVILFVLFLLAFTLGSRVVQGLGGMIHVEQEAQAAAAAHAGLARALYALEANEPFVPTGCRTSAAPDELRDQPLPDQERFSVTLTNNASRMVPECSGSAVAPDGTEVPPGIVYLAATGRAGNVTRRSRMMVKLDSGWAFTYAVFAGRGLAFTGQMLIDSFQSANGPYGGGNIGNNGNIGTNSSKKNAVALSKNGFVNGTIWVGPRGSLTKSIHSDRHLQNYTSAALLAKVVPLPPVADPLNGYGTDEVLVRSVTSPLPPGRYDSIVVKDGTLVLSCGNYSVKRLKIDRSQIAVDPGCSLTNPVNVYVHQSLLLEKNSEINPGGNAAALLLYGMPKLRSVKINDVTGSFALYAPNARLNVKDSVVMGSLIGKKGAFENLSVHFDEALFNARTTTTGARVTVKGWASP